MERLLDYFIEQLNYNMEMRFAYKGIDYHLDYDNEKCYVSNESTGEIYYEGTKKNILDEFVIDSITFREILIRNLIDIII